MQVVEVVPVEQIAKERNIKCSVPFNGDIGKCFVIEGICIPVDHYVLHDDPKVSVPESKVWEREGIFYTEIY